MPFPFCVCRLCRELSKHRIDRAFCSTDCEPCKAGYLSPGCTGRCRRRDNPATVTPDPLPGSFWESKIPVGEDIQGIPTDWNGSKVNPGIYFLKEPRPAGKMYRRTIRGAR